MRRAGWTLLLVLLGALTAAAPAAEAQSGAATTGGVCGLIEQAARANDLPVAVMTRIIRSESGFRRAAVSPAGAEGIAQFMPGTAAKRGLADPFDPEQAIPEAARLLGDLARQFGNLGMAAAAYNAGAARVAAWLRGDGELPAETRAYVRAVTQRSVDDWRGQPAGDLVVAATPGDESCLAVAAAVRDAPTGFRGSGGGGLGVALPAPRGAQLAGIFQREFALMTFARSNPSVAPMSTALRPAVVSSIFSRGGGSVVSQRFAVVRLPAPSSAGAAAPPHR